MARTRPRKPKVHPIRSQNEPETPFDSAVAVEDPPEPQQPTPEAAPPAAEPPPRPSFKKRDPTGKHMTFFDRVAAVSLADWGTRAKVKVYRLDPIIDRTRGSEYKFVQIYHQAIDEDKLKVDHGSGRYRLYLNIKEAGDRNEKETDTVEIDILDPKFPPNIPAGEWVDDPRNKKWAWARPAGAPGSPQAQAAIEAPAVAVAAANQFIEGVKVANEIRKDLKSEYAPSPDAKPQSGLSESLQIVNAILTMKADNPMVDVMKEQLRLSTESAEKSRQREADLQKEIRDSLRARDNGAPAAKFGLKEALGEIKEFLPALKEVMPGLGAAAEVVRAGRTTGWDILKDLLSSTAPTLIDYAGKIALAYATRMPTPQNGQQTIPPNLQLAAPQGPPQANGQAPAAGQQAPAQPQQMPPKFFIFLSQPTVQRALMKYFGEFKQGDTEAGEDFAAWALDGEGAEVLQDARALGTTTIINGLKGSPFWTFFAADEAKLVAFVDQALGWSPPRTDTIDDSDAEGDGDDGDDKPVDLTTRRGI
jgi:hypothetical protein